MTSLALGAGVGDPVVDALRPVIDGPPVKRSAGALEALENAERAVAEDPVRLQLESRKRQESLVILKVVRLAPSLEVAEALLRGERVPVSRLDPEWAKAYGLA